VKALARKERILKTETLQFQKHFTSNK